MTEKMTEAEEVTTEEEKITDDEMAANEETAKNKEITTEEGAVEKKKADGGKAEKTGRGKEKLLQKIKRQGISAIGMWVCGMLIVIAVVILLVQVIDRKRAETIYDELQSQVNGIPLYVPPVVIAESESVPEDSVPEGSEPKEPETVDILEEKGIVIPEKNLDWEALKEQNADIYAWIYVPDTLVDYPVLQHPTDNSYYLDYNLDGSKGYPGCIYTENYNSKDFMDPHTVMYGHNMKNKTMFASLHDFEDRELFAGDHYIFIYTPGYVFVYQIFGAYDFPDIHLLANYNYDYEGVFARYLQGIYEVPDTSSRVANIREDIKVTENDRILTLSTCTKDNGSYRFLVVGVLLNPPSDL